MNLEKLKPSRKKPRAGDIFAIKPVGHPYYFGRVIRDDALPLGPDGGPCLLLYVYDAHSTKIDSIPVLSKNELIIAPVFSNLLGWRKGYFQTIQSSPLGEDDALELHCFRQPFLSPTGLIDEYFNPLPEGTPAVDLAGLDNYRTIDIMVSKSLGLSLETAGEE